ncbi:MAG: RluA family pseudouridine synthase [Sediminispirochaetaceae bacterium]
MDYQTISDYRTLSHIVDEPEAEGLRADKYIADFLELFTRSQLKQREVQLRMDGTAVKPSKPVKYGTVLEISYKPLPPQRIEAEKIPLDILYEDASVVVVNKPAGMVVHPAAGNFSGTLVQGLLYHVKSLKERFPDQEVRPGIVHRLDKDTSGVIAAAKNPESFAFLSRQFAERRVKKHYLAVVRGFPDPAEGTIRYPIARDRHNRKKFTWKRTDGKEACTEYKTLRRLPTFSNLSLLLLKPNTGRTHQLRVHISSIGYPIAGDPLYGKSRQGEREWGLMLHAYSLTLELPEGGRKTFRAPLPEGFRTLLVHC